MADLNGKVAIVTGAASGLGKATAEVLAADGAAVLVADINRHNAEIVAKDLIARGHRATALSPEIQFPVFTRPQGPQILIAGARSSDHDLRQQKHPTLDTSATPPTRCPVR